MRQKAVQCIGGDLAPTIFGSGTVDARLPALPLVLGHSRYIFARYVMHQDLQTLLRSHCQAEAIGGVPIEILHDRMKTAVTGEDGNGHIVYNRSLLTLARRNATA